MTSSSPPEDPARTGATTASDRVIEEAFRDRYFRSGLGLRREVRGEVEAEYHSDLVQELREGGFRLVRDGLTLRLAREFGFCYGVERAVDYAYEALSRFPDRRIVLTGEIIHNPKVNSRLRKLGIRFLGEPDIPEIGAVRQEDVALLPAFGVAAPEFEVLRQAGCVVIDTTCGSVLNVWKNVERYAREGRTSIVHGKYEHEETRATVSRVLLTEGAHYLVVLDMEEAELVADTVRGEDRAGAWTRQAFLARFQGRMSPGFDPDRDLTCVGMANQTTMLSGESLSIAEKIREALEDRYGEEALAERFRSFDTICSATQDRQDALHELLVEPLDLVLVIGGYNSSNTGHLLEIAEQTVRAFHIKGPECLVSPTTIRHSPSDRTEEVESEVEGGWLPEGEVKIGLTAGASTPDVVIGAVMARVLALRSDAGPEATG